MSAATLEAAELNPDQTLELFKFYQAAADQAKAHAWSQTTWVLTLNAAILGFSVNLLTAVTTRHAFLVVEVLSCGVGVLLCGFLVYLLNESGGHIGHYWAASNRIAGGHAPLIAFVGEKNARLAHAPGHRVTFPRFCRRLQCLAGLFAIAHIGWLLAVSSSGQI